MRHYRNSALRRSDVLNFVFKERPKFLASTWSMLGDWRAAERVFHELVTALDEEPEFRDLDTLQTWCWTSVSNRCHNLNERGCYRRLHLPDLLLAELDAELQGRDQGEIGDYADALRPCLSLLPNSGRWVVQAFYGDGKTGLEAARLLNLKPESFYRELQRVHASLSRCQQKRVAMGTIPRFDLNPRDAEFERCALRYLDDQLTEEDLNAFARELGEDLDRMRQFNDLRLSCALLRDSDPVLVSPVRTRGGEISKFVEQRRRTRTWAFSYFASTLIVTSLVAIFSLIHIREPASPAPVEDEPLATYVRGAGAQFFGRETPSFGDPLNKGTYTLSKGTIQLQFAKGAEMTIEGPADFSIRSADKVRLRQGTVRAVVPKPAVGFTVATKIATIRDLGTEFGVSTQPGGKTDVVVFEGEVEVEASGESSRGPETIRGGEGLQFSKNGITKISSSQEAWRFPHSIPSSEPSSSRDNLLKNPSFEHGPLSLTPHSDHRYRDMATAWNRGQFANGKWKEDCPVSSAGTVVCPSVPSMVPTPPDGVRCLFLNAAAARQQIEGLKAGGRYQLSIGIARPPTELSAARIIIALLSGEKSINTQSEPISAGKEFTEYRFEFTVPREGQDTEHPLYLMLSAEEGTVFCDSLRLTPIPRGK